eukprot:gene5520-9337_t
MSATKSMVAYCFSSLISKLEKTGHHSQIDFENEKFPLFVTWYKRQGKNYRLRGCIGTFEHIEIHEGLSEYALISALKDRRFSPIKTDELDLLKCSISLLVNFEDGKDAYDWVIGKHGIRISFSHPKSNKRLSATYLPMVCKEQGWNKEECLLSLMEKAGYDGDVDDELIDEIKLIRYQSSVCDMTYQEYCTLVSITNPLKNIKK